MVGDDIAVVGERFLAEGAYAILGDDLPVEEFPHFAVGPKFPVSPGMMRIFNAPNAHLALASFSWDCFSAAAEERTVNRAQLITAESHGVLLIDLGAMTRSGQAGNGIVRLSHRKRIWRAFRLTCASSKAGCRAR